MRCVKPSEKQKPKQKKGLWSPYEDQKLRDYILQYGHGCWSSVPINAGLERNGKSCRLRWINYLRPGLKRGMFSPQEEDTILTLHAMFGNKWSQIAQHLPGRTDNEIKNYWHSYLKKRMAKKSQTDTKTKTEFIIPNTESSSFSSQISSTTRNPSFESFQTMAGLGQGMDSTYQSNLPRLLFTEWLSLDQFQGQPEFGSNTSEPAVSKDGIDPVHHDSFISSLFLDEGSSGNNGFHQQELSNNGSSMEEVFQMGNGFVNFMEDDDDDELYRHFNMSDGWNN